MRDYFKGITEYPIRIIPLAVCGMILASAISLYVSIFEKNEMDERINALSEETVELEWSVI